MRIRVKLTPLEPYFFGGDDAGGGAYTDKYYVRSLDAPSQTALFGVLRYLGISNPQPDFARSQEDIANTGSESFRLTAQEQSFGRIKCISPLYLLDRQERYYIKTPFDHNTSLSKQSVYEPFLEYMQTGDIKLPTQYSEKEGIADSWLCLDDGSIHEDIFLRVTNIGIDKELAQSGSAFYKKEFIVMSSHSFVFFADVEEGFCYPEKRVVYMGQKKCAFKAEVDEREEPRVKARWHKDIVYAQSDLFVPTYDELLQLYKACSFVCVQTQPTREFITVYDARTHLQRYHQPKDSRIQLIQAGSVFIPNDVETVKKIVCENKHARIVGFNRLLKGGDVL